ncbi:hypothetical protein GQS52_18165 [Streptomyces sp. SCUT-3]|uniref:hypothetical protein n=1 Tax=Streptomyces sp. SCUT-3 TaxID=2684469 RepID=UPI0015FAD358|nr:hypothetical protein [Streptomyces sp. SCUT-3]QMV23371.1 hypothetical protein GQS52_18165 [Streptomyces sp. SCUT-3]
MTAPRLRLAAAGEAAGLAAFLARLLHFDKAAVVRLRAGGEALALFGNPPFGGVLAVRTARLAQAADLDVTVSAGQLLDGTDEEDGTLAVPSGVTGPPWTGLLPPRGGWSRTAEFDADDARRVVAAAVAEFRARSEALDPDRRTRAGLDALADEIWSRSPGGTGLPLRALHAAHALGFLRPTHATSATGAAATSAAGIAAGSTGGGEGAEGAAGPAEELVLLAAGPWLMLRTPYGAVAVRRAGPASGLSVTPA